MASPNDSWSRAQRRTLAALIGCIAIYGITISLFTPLLSVTLESRGTSASLIGALVMIVAVGVIVGSFAVPVLMRKFGARSLLLLAVVIEIAMVFLLWLFDHLAAWFVARFVMGVTGAFLFVVSETWINEIAPEQSRGAVIGFYNTIFLLSMAVGPIILGLTMESVDLPFLIGILLMSIAGITVAFADTHNLVASGSRSPFGIVGVARVAPLLVGAGAIVAFKEGATFGLLPIYGLRTGLDENSAVMMLSVSWLGAAVLQFPIGVLADRWSRTRVLVTCGVSGMVGAVALPFVVGTPWLLWPMLFIWTGMFSGIYTLAMVLAGQWFRGIQLATTMAAIGLAWGIGGIVGPIASGFAMDIWNPHGLALVLAVGAAVFVLFSLMPSTRRPSLVNH